MCDVHKSMKSVDEKRPVRRSLPLAVRDKDDVWVTSFDVGIKALGIALVHGPTRPSPGDDMLSHIIATAEIILAEPVSLRVDNGLNEKKIEDIPVSEATELFWLSMIRRTDTMLLPGGAPPKIVAVENQPKSATNKTKKMDGVIMGCMTAYYDMLWRGGSHATHPMILHDSGRGKGELARAVMARWPREFACWMQKEATTRQFLTWSLECNASDTAMRREEDPAWFDDIVDSAARQCVISNCVDEFEDVIGAFASEYARERLARDPQWIKRLNMDATRRVHELGRKATRGKKRTTSGKGKGKKRVKKDTYSMEETLAHVLGGGVEGGEDDVEEEAVGGERVGEEVTFHLERADEFIDGAQERVEKTISGKSAKPMFAFGRMTRRRERQRANREWNKYIVLSGFEVLLDNMAEIGRAPSWFERWKELRNKPKTHSDLRRDAADAAMQALNILWSATKPKP